eukprot:SAG11_NODE_17210_length_525_cov_0.835681_1_plen_103_part_00
MQSFAARFSSSCNKHLTVLEEVVVRKHRGWKVLLQCIAEANLEVARVACGVHGVPAPIIFHTRFSVSHSTIVKRSERDRETETYFPHPFHCFSFNYCETFRA